MSITPQQHAEWLKRLRSSKYEQGKGVLKLVANPDTDERLPKPLYCCLGVLAGILCEQGSLTEAPLDPHDHVASFVLTYDAEGAETNYEALLPPTFINEHRQNTYAKLNDEGKPFDAIADIIEADKKLLVKETT